MKSLKLYRLACGCTARVVADEFSEQWKCETLGCEAEVYPHQLREWPKTKDGNLLPKPKDSAIKVKP